MSNLFSYDPDELKTSLIEYLQTKPEFADFNYEGSALNTQIDLLVRNTHYIAYQANMVGTESFLDSAQLRANVVSHAQKLSYIPRSRTSSTIVVDIEVIPTVAPSAEIYSITCNKGSSFINTVGNVSYSFTNPNDIVLTRTVSGTFKASNVELKQGQLLKHQYLYNGEGNPIEIPNSNIDSSTIRVFGRDSATDTTTSEFIQVDNITDVGASSRVFYLAENTFGKFEIEFGKNILGYNPPAGAVINVEYISVENNHANGLETLVAASSIEGYSNIQLTTVTPAYGGSEKDSIDVIKFMAPKIYEAQNRAVRAVDYAVLLRREFPFIRSAIAWGGETNVPPYYGKVFMAAIPKEGFVIANSVKSVMESRIAEFSMMDPIIVDAEFVGLELSIDIVFNSNKTSNTFAQTSSLITDVVNSYNDTLRTFSAWYNNSTLSSRIRNEVPAVESVEIHKNAIIEFDVTYNTNKRYEVFYNNAIEPGSFTIDDVIVNELASSQGVFDDENGNVYSTYTLNGVTVTNNIGTINYETGHVDITASFKNTGSLVARMAPESDNFYTERNYAVYIRGLDVNRVVV